ncbi:lipopolysaccharide heptosyltransferase II [Vibrio breoganii]|uniref:lipopolysaccharide heptosyltransferase II n=1 Tax=Vibrio breoganii TaxID=553239 RepID=A0ABX1UAV7_9VIBR|nr:lipopolysaccharide heptosyltransferase II [Vibrio breoganii]NMO75059.1 lipopolysaccharide heptosyltransferase II [Vibrio breoganii]NMR71618.1 lipopolysaccharide heptosyltransferase II [Vibrio breoganii]OED99205.1 lipopolysaccharide heptosyltransferase II [Vibrio breoganii ZF-29]OEF81004.1 lipopolysaccharide heptosyltransferase II [Vibrio breoganii 1C10]PML87202.1 lipopolysaccharide heptosyltransferase II [Vibrio breoganii]
MPSKPTKILIIGPSWVGDMVMSQSLYRTLKEQFPSSDIDVLAPAWCKPVLDRMPEVSKAIDMPLGHGQLCMRTRYQLGKQLSKEGYSHAYILPNSAKSALIPLIARIPNRIGWKGEMRYGLLTDVRQNRKQFKYMVERYVALAHPKKDMLNSESLGGLDNLAYPRLEIPEVDRTQALDKFKLDLARPVVGLCPGAEFGPSKQWPIEHFASVANEVIRQGFQVWIFGSQNDKNIGDSLTRLVNDDNKAYVTNLAGSSSLVEAIDLISCCKTVISNDSGAMHIAAAVGCSVIGLYGSTSPNYTPPLSKDVAILSTNIECRPCFERECPYGHLKCLKELTPAMVLEAFNKLTPSQADSSLSN